MNLKVPASDVLVLPARGVVVLRVADAGWALSSADLRVGGRSFPMLVVGRGWAGPNQELVLRPIAEAPVLEDVARALAGAGEVQVIGLRRLLRNPD